MGNGGLEPQAKGMCVCVCVCVANFPLKLKVGEGGKSC